LIVVLLLAGILVVAPAPGALAACHRFDLEVSEDSPDEGGSVTVTVSRDGAADDSGVRVGAINGTARAGSDFTDFDQQVNFTGDATERSFVISIVSDGTAEPAETFTLRLTQPTGCSVNPNFDLADPVAVRISASQGSAAPPAPAPAPPPAPAPTPAPAPAPGSPVRPTAPATPSEEPTPEETETATPSPSPTMEEDSDGGGISPQLIVGVLALLGAIGVGAWLLNQRRNQPPAI